MAIKPIKLTNQDNELLKNVNLNQVGTIVENIEIFFDFLEDGIIVTDRLQMIKKKDLILLNNALSKPSQTDSARPRQNSYPDIHGLYLLALSSGLVKKRLNLKSKKAYLLQNKIFYREWDSLSDEQKYLNLLVTWFTATLDIIDESIFSSHPLYFISYYCLDQLSTDQWVESSQIGLDYKHNNGLFNFALAEMFGFIDLQIDLTQSKWKMEKVKLTPLGLAFIRLLYQKVTSRTNMIDNQFYSLEKKEVPTNIFEYALVPYFPHWSYLSPHPSAKAPLGRYTFLLTIDYHDAQAIFSISCYESLHELVLFILHELVNFDMDHLYHFYYQDARCQTKMAYHPELYGDNDTEEYKYADQLSLQDINLEIGQMITLVYDLGEQWHFRLLVMDFVEENENEPPKIIETKGEPPLQYGYYEDDEDDDEEDTEDVGFD